MNCTGGGSILAAGRRGDKGRLESEDGGGQVAEKVAFVMRRRLVLMHAEHAQVSIGVFMLLSRQDVTS